MEWNILSVDEEKQEGQGTVPGQNFNLQTWKLPLEIEKREKSADGP